MSATLGIGDREIVRLIEDFLTEHRFAISVRDLMDLTGYRSPASIYFRLKALREEGLIDWEVGISRSLHVTEDGLAWLETGDE